MRISFTALVALAAPVFAQKTTPAPTPTGNWFGLGPSGEFSDPAKWSSIYNSLISVGKIPSTLTTAPWPTGSWGSSGHWGGPSGAGPWGSSNYGPWSEWSTRSDWRSGPWTAWWDGSACPSSNWPGWTAGPWKSAAPWTTWSGCSAHTTATSIVTRMVNGTLTATTTFGLQVAAAAASGTTTPQDSKGGVEAVTAGVGMAIGAAVLGIAVGL